MPPKPHRSDTRPAEQVLEDLLKAWPPGPEARARTPAKRRPFTTAFLPPASHQPPRLPVFRLKTPPMARVDLRPMLGRAEGEPRRLPSRIGATSFQTVADAVAARGAGPAAPGPAAERAADEPSPDSGEDYRFAAQVVALKAAGALDPPAASGGGSPAPSGHAEPYAEESTAATTRDTSADALSALAAILELGSRPVHLDRAYPRQGGPAFPFSDDDGAAAPSRSIFL